MRWADEKPASEEGAGWEGSRQGWERSELGTFAVGLVQTKKDTMLKVRGGSTPEEMNRADVLDASMAK